MALLHKNLLKSVVSIGILNKKGKFESIATGFIVGFLSNRSKNPEKKIYHTFLVTNRHVFKDKDKVWLRFNVHLGASAKSFPVDLLSNKKPDWLAHSNNEVDLAMLTISSQFLQTHNVDFKFVEEDGLFAYTKDFDKNGIGLGDSLYVLGFPMGISGDWENYVIARNGSIARIDKEILKKTKAFLIDSQIFPGNSGGPVFMQPNAFASPDSSSIDRPYLIGIVSGYRYHQEFLYSHQSDPPQIVAATLENSGLATVVPMDYAKEIYNKWRKDRKKVERAKASEVENT